MDGSYSKRIAVALESIATSMDLHTKLHQEQLDIMVEARNEKKQREERHEKQAEEWASMMMRELFGDEWQSATSLDWSKWQESSGGGDTPRGKIIS